MQSKRVISPALQELIRLQQGVVSAGQLLGAGLTRSSIRRLRCEGIFHRHADGIYSLDQELRWVQRCWLGVLMGGDLAVISGLAAAHVDGWYRPEPDVIDVFTTRQLISPSPSLSFVRGTRLGRGEPCRTRPEVAIIDAARGLRPEELLGLIADATFARRTTPERIRYELENFPRATNRAFIRELIGDVKSGIMSVLEGRYAYDVEQAHGLPRGLRQQKTVTGHPSDVVYEQGLIVEIDGKLGHTGRDVSRDRQLDRRNLLSGRATLRYGFAEVTYQPCVVASEVAEILIRLGWAGEPRRCRRCAGK
ncbi:MAG: type IV toxin-antitoxin system AbiEi family antitoxin domain-containing protein [Propionibacteriaceae bacterium]